VLAGIRRRPARIEEVARHYGPWAAVAAERHHFIKRKRWGDTGNLVCRCPVGMRHSRPFIRETLDEMTGDGVRRALGFILSSHQTEASWQRYLKDITQARLELGDCAPEIDYCPGWHSHPLFIQVWEEQIAKEMLKLTAAERADTPLIFTAHSVPSAMAANSPYCEQLKVSCSLVAGRLDHTRWSLAYQSRSGNPCEPWLEPDISAAFHNVAAEGATEVIVAPIGFRSRRGPLRPRHRTNKLLKTGPQVFRASAPNDHRLHSSRWPIIEAAVSGNRYTPDEPPDHRSRRRYRGTTAATAS
jgi:ferrochelatase